MNNNYKYLIWSGTAVTVILAIFLLASTNRFLNPAATTNTVSFNGEGKVLAKPNIAVISLSIVTEAVTSKIAQDDNSKKSKAVTDFLKSQNIEEKDIKTTGYNIYPQYRYPQYDKPEIRGYQVNQTLEVKVRDLDKVSGILDGVVSAGVNQVNSLSFEIDDPESLKADARKKAIDDAKKKADELEDQLGVNLGKIVNFSESIGGVPVPIYYDKAIGLGGMGGGGPSVPVGENEMVINVTITYQIR